jgi:hypothetical protein
MSRCHNIAAELIRKILAGSPAPFENLTNELQIPPV